MLDLRSSALPLESTEQFTASRSAMPRTDNKETTLHIGGHLAAAASADQRLKELLVRVASGVASPAELAEFKSYVSAIPSASDESEREYTPIPRIQKPAASYTQPFLDFINENPTVFHTVTYFEDKLEKEGFVKLNERVSWAAGDSKLKKGGKYYISRNGSSLIAFVVGEHYKVGESGVAMIAGHVDALTARRRFIPLHPRVLVCR